MRTSLSAVTRLLDSVPPRGRRLCSSTAKTQGRLRRRRRTADAAQGRRAANTARLTLSVLRLAFRVPLGFVDGDKRDIWTCGRRKARVGFRRASPFRPDASVRTVAVEQEVAHVAAEGAADVAAAVGQSAGQTAAVEGSKGVGAAGAREGTF